jgi:hypothetical protein
MMFSSSPALSPIPRRYITSSRCAWKDVPNRGACPHRRELNDTAGDSDRKGRDGVNPSTTYLSRHIEQMCRRGACPLATLAVAGDPNAVLADPNAVLADPIAHGVLTRPHKRDRKGRDGVNPQAGQATPLHHISAGISSRCVDVGLVPSRPLRSLYPQRGGGQPHRPQRGGGQPHSPRCS